MNDDLNPGELVFYETVYVYPLFLKSLALGFLPVFLGKEILLYLGHDGPNTVKWLFGKDVYYSDKKLCRFVNKVKL